jgi:hypothetical protein
MHFLLAKLLYCQVLCVDSNFKDELRGILVSNCFVFLYLISNWLYNMVSEKEKAVFGDISQQQTVFRIPKGKGISRQSF